MRYDKRIGITCLMAAIVFGALAVFSEGVSFVGALTPVAFLGFGVQFLTRPYLIVGDRELIAKVLIGRTQDTYRLDPTDGVEVDGKRVFLVIAGERRKLRVTGWMADRRDWGAFLAWTERRGWQG